MSEFSIGVDLGGTNLRLGAYAGDGSELGPRIVLPTRRTGVPEDVVGDIVATVHQLVRDRGGARHLIGVGVGTPGPLELPAGVLTFPPNLPGWERFPLKDILTERLGCRVVVDSDANVAALGESVLGAGRHSPKGSLCLIALGTGVGSGVILNGRVWYGFRGMAGESGHVPVRPNGVLCGCGSYGCLEQYASAPGISRMMRERLHLRQSAPFEHELSARAVAYLAQAGDADAIAVFEETGQALGMALAGLVNNLNLSLYVIGGGVADAWKLFAPAMFQELSACSSVYRLTAPRDPEGFPEEQDRTYVVPSALGAKAGLVGAALLPFLSKDEVKTPGVALSVGDAISGEMQLPA